MRYWLHVHGTPATAQETRLSRETIGAADEVLCGACQALLTVDHRMWVNAEGPDRPGDSAGLVSCQLCGSVNDASRVSRQEPGPA